jgi:hypothetical protein
MVYVSSASNQVERRKEFEKAYGEREAFVSAPLPGREFCGYCVGEQVEWTVYMSRHVSEVELPAVAAEAMMGRMVESQEEVVGVLILVVEMVN